MRGCTGVSRGCEERSNWSLSLSLDIYIYIYIYIYGEKNFDPTKKWLEHGMRYIFFFMPDLESTGSETHESAIKKNLSVFFAYGSSGSIDIQSIYLVLHVNTYEYIYIYMYTSTYVDIHIVCMFVSMYTS